MSLQSIGPVLLVGAGKMGGAMLEGWIDRGLPAEQICVLEPNAAAELRATASGQGLRLNPEKPNAPPPKVVVLAVKPQVMDDVLQDVVRYVPEDAVVLSIAAGKTIANIAAHLPKGQPIIRTIPNTPAAIGRGITVCVANGVVSDEQREAAGELLSACGEVAWIEDEGLMDAVTAVSGSGPAYVFLLAESLADAGVAAGLSPELARRLALATVSGAGELLRASGLEPDVLRKNVTSPGGTTEAALKVLMAPGAIPDLMREGVAAATRRGKELAD
ncbi:pyrroline-5-carboxylate reductase [Microbaculum marinum]|uniref:Pyrroline-5-carboxylate reductase n=1 Tax=Microbaculum marinum TaxID=1764581 RepID=A0AAW9RTG5_9HYPH